MTSLIFPGVTATASCVVDVFVFLLVMALCDIAMAYLFIYLFARLYLTPTGTYYSRGPLGKYTVSGQRRHCILPV